MVWEAMRRSIRNGELGFGLPNRVDAALTNRTEDQAEAKGRGASNQVTAPRATTRREFIKGMAAAGITVGAFPAILVPRGQVTFSFGNGGTAPEIAARKQVAELYMTQHPNVTINYQYADPSSFSQKLPVQFHAGTAPDVVMVAESWILGYVQVGALADLSSYMKKDGLKNSQWTGGGMGPGTVLRHVYAIPVETYPKGIAYNKKLFDQHSIPIPKDGWSETEFVSAAEALTDKANDIWGMNNTLQGGDCFSIYGGELFDVKSNRMTATSSKVVKAVQFAENLVRKGAMPQLGSVSQVTGAGSYYNAFTTGKFGLDIFAGYDTAAWVPQIASRFEWNVVTFPKEWYGNYQYQGVAIWEGSKNKAAAWEFAKFLSTDEQAQKLIGTYATPAWRQSATAWLSAMPSGFQGLNWQPLIKGLGRLIPGVGGGVYNQIGNDFTDQQEAVEDKGLAPKTAMQTLQKRGQLVLDQAGPLHVKA